jgi:hypothetical protein
MRVARDNTVNEVFRFYHYSQQVNEPYPFQTAYKQINIFFDRCNFLFLLQPCICFSLSNALSILSTLS